MSVNPRKPAENGTGVFTFCSIPECKSTFDSVKEDGKKLYFHKFPMKDTKRLHKWIQFTKRKSFTPSVSHICSLHFRPNDYRDPINGLLKKTAVPSILPVRKSALTSSDVPDVINLSATVVLEKLPKSLRTKAQKQDPLRPTIRPHPLSIEFPITPDVGFASVLRKNKIVQTAQLVPTPPAPVQSLSLEKEKYLKKQISTLRRARYKLKKKIAAWPERKKGMMEVFQFLEDSFQNMPILSLLKNHFSNMKVKVPERKFSREMKEFAIVLYSHSPKAYNYVNNFLKLPKPHQVIKWRNEEKQDPSVLMGDADLVETDESVVPVIERHMYDDYPSHIFPITD